MTGCMSRPHCVYVCKAAEGIWDRSRTFQMVLCDGWKSKHLNCLKLLHSTVIVYFIGSLKICMTTINPPADNSCSTELSVVTLPPSPWQESFPPSGTPAQNMLFVRCGTLYHLSLTSWLNNCVSPAPPQGGAHTSAYFLKSVTCSSLQCQSLTTVLKYIEDTIMVNSIEKKQIIFSSLKAEQHSYVGTWRGNSKKMSGKWGKINDFTK